MIDELTKEERKMLDNEPLTLDQRLATYFQRFGDVDIKELPQTKLISIEGVNVKRVVGHYRYPRVKVIVTSKDMVEIIKAEAGGHTSRLHMKWRWEAQNDTAIAFCKRILPHLHSKPRELCQFLIDYSQNANRLGQTSRYMVWLERIKAGKEPYKPFNPVELT